METLWEDFLDWLSSLDGSPDPASTVPSPVIGLVIAVILIAAVIIAKPRLNHRERQVKEVFGTESVLAAADYRRRAESSAAAGRWADAVVDRFRALVRSAEDRTILDPQPGRTADEVARDLALPFSTEAQRLGWAAGTFDAIRYGNRAADEGDYRAMASLDNALEALRPVRSPDHRDGSHQDHGASHPAALP